MHVHYQVNVFTQSVQLLKQYMSQIGSDKCFRSTDVKATYQDNQEHTDKVRTCTFVLLLKILYTQNTRVGSQAFCG